MTIDAETRRFASRGHRCEVIADFEVGARALGLDRPDSYDRTLQAASLVEAGRGRNFLLNSDAWPARIRLRPLRHVGLLGKWGGDRYLRSTSGRREFRLWRALEENGAPLPRVVLTTSRRRGVFWRSALGSVNIEEAPNLIEWLGANGSTPEKLRPIAIAAARAIRRFHDAGGLHRDLHLGNILVDTSEDPLCCWIVDLARARREANPPAHRRMQDLMRLARSAEKHGQRACLDTRIVARFLSAYCQGDRDLRRALLRYSPREMRRIRRHRVGWRIARQFAITAMAFAQLACSDAGEKVRSTHGPIPRLSLLATGDTGRTRSFPELFEGQLAVAHAMDEEDRIRPVDGLVLLGDNFYWHGLEPTQLVDQIARNLVRPYCRFLDLSGPRSGEVESNCRVPSRDRHPIPIFAVLGNHDLDHPESPRLQRTVVPDFLVGWKMSPGLASVHELNHGVSLILFESEVAIDDQDAITAALVAAIQEARGPWRIIATHRPIATDDLGHDPKGGYPGWVREAIAQSERSVQLVLAGHHHNLQAIAMSDPTSLLQIGAGSGSRAMPPLASPSVGALFGAIEVGFVRVDLVGDVDDERLSVSLFRSSAWPIIARLGEHSLLARFEVDRMGKTRDVTSHVESSSALQ